MKSRINRLTAVALWAVAFLPLCTQAKLPDHCEVGVYRFSDGSIVDVAAADDDTLRWLMFSGERGQLHPRPAGGWMSTYGWTDRPDGRQVSFGGCKSREIIFDNARGRRVDFEVKNMTFESAEVQLAGRLEIGRAHV